MRGFPEIIADVGFNRDDDIKEFGCGSKIVSINYFEEDTGEKKLGLSFNLGHKEDDTITLVFDCKELLSKEVEAITEAV